MITKAMPEDVAFIQKVLGASLPQNYVLPDDIILTEVLTSPTEVVYIDQEAGIVGRAAWQPDVMQSKIVWLLPQQKPLKELFPMLLQLLQALSDTFPLARPRKIYGLFGSMSGCLSYTTDALVAKTQSEAWAKAFPGVAGSNEGTRPIRWTVHGILQDLLPVATDAFL